MVAILKKMSSWIGLLLFLFCFTALITPQFDSEKIFLAFATQLTVHASSESVQLFSEKLLQNCPAQESLEQLCNDFSEGTISLEQYIAASFSTQTQSVSVDSLTPGLFFSIFGVILGILLTYFGSESVKDFVEKLFKSMRGYAIFLILLLFVLFFYIQFIVVDTSSIFNLESTTSQSALIQLIPFVLYSLIIESFFLTVGVVLILTLLLFLVLSLLHLSQPKSAK